MFLARFNQSRSIGVAQILCWICVVFASCSEKKQTGPASGGGEPYYHPTVATAQTTTSVSASRSTAKDLSLTQDVVLQLGTAKVTIPKGAVHELGTASLQNFEGPFVNTSSMRMVTESMLLVIRKTDATDFPRTEIFKDILIEQTTTQKTIAVKMVQLYQEDAELSTAAKTGLAQKAILSYYADQGSGSYLVTSKIRHPRIAFVIAEATSGGLPSGFSTFVEPAKDPTVLTVASTTPADVTLSWSGNPQFNAGGYGVVYYAAGSTELDSTYKNIVTATSSTTIDATTTSADYTFSVSGLLDATTYTFKVCGLNSRTKADASAGATVAITMPTRAHAVLTNAPHDPSNTAALNITVGGTNIAEYQYALVSAQTNCSGATFSSWTPVATPITDSIPQATGTQMVVCVLGKIDSSNVQLVSTDVPWLVDKTPPTFTSLALVAPALDGYLSTADRALTTVITGTLTATGNDATLTKYVIVSSATVCNNALTYGAPPAANSSAITVDGNYKVCAQIYDSAGNDAYGASAIFAVDTTISFTAATLANQAADTYINLAESSLTGNLVNAATGVGFTTAKYALVPVATTCNVAVTYVAAIPKSNSASFGADGDYVVCVDLSDAAGNHAYGSSPTIHLKKAVPAFSSISLANDAVDGYINAADHLLTSALSTAAVGTNYNTLQYGIQTAAGLCSAVGVWNASIPLANTASLAVDGTSYKVCAKFTDAAGNPAAYGNTPNFLYDVTAPIFTSLPLANDAIDGYLNSSERAANLAVTSVSVSSGSSSESYSVQLNGTTCNASLTYTAGLVLAGDAGFATNAAYKVCVRLTDLAGNLSYGASSSITRVSSVPDCTSIALANDAADGWLNSAESSASNALSTSAATSLGSPVRTYAVIASGATCDNTAAFGAQDVIPASNTAGLVDGSSYKICAKVTDVAMSTPAYCATGVFVVDLTAPVFNSLPLANAAIDTYINIADHSLVTAVAGPLSATGQTRVCYRSRSDHLRWPLNV